MAKGEIALFKQFLLLSRCFQKLSAADASNAFIGGKGLKDLPSIYTKLSHMIPKSKILLTSKDTDQYAPPLNLITIFSHESIMEDRVTELTKY